MSDREAVYARANQLGLTMAQADEMLAFYRQGFAAGMERAAVIAEDELERDSPRIAAAIRAAKETT